MKGDFMLKAICPTCKKSISVIASEQDGNCPECGQPVPQLMMFCNAMNQEPEEPEVVVKDNKPKKKEHQGNDLNGWVELGSIITIGAEHKKQFIVISKKGQNQFLCMRVISGKGKNVDTRYVYRLDDENLILLDGSKTIKASEIVSVGPTCSQELVEKLNDERTKRMKRASKMPKVKKAKLPRANFDPGNAWDGLKTVQGYVKVFRG